MARVSRLSCALASLGCMGLAGPAMAQTAGPAAPAADGLETVTVTARRRVESAQEVPISMSVVDAAEVRSLSTALSNAEIARRTPNFNFVDLGGQYANSGNIRGVGSLSPLSTTDTSVSFNVGEVPQSTYGLPPSLLDLQRVEVLRGPQGTLYGRNSQGGAVNFVPNQPRFERTLSLRTEAGSRGWALGELVANAPLDGDRLAGRLALQYSRHAGDVANVVAGGDDGQARIGSARGSLLFVPDGRTLALLGFSYNKTRDSQPRFLLRDADCYPCSGLNPANDIAREDAALNLRVERDFGAFVLTSLTNLQRNRYTQRLDMTDSLVFARLTRQPPARFGNPAQDVYQGRLDEKTFYQELRLASPEGSAWRWTTGVNFLRSDFGAQTQGRDFTMPNFGSFSGSQDNDIRTDSYALFGEVSVPLTERLQLLAGLRLTHETADATYRYTGGGLPGTVAPYRQASRHSDSYATGRTGLSYDWSPALMTYATVARGAAGGGYPWNASNNPFGGDEPSFPTSTSTTWEAGWKAALLDGRMTLNGAVFHNDVKKGHLFVYNPRRFAYETATLDYASQGAEAEARWRVTPALSLEAGLGYTRARLRDVPAGTLTGARSGNAVPNTPRFSSTLGAEYRLPAAALGLPGTSVYVNGRYQHVGSRAADVGNAYRLGSYGIVDARMGWTGRDAEVYLFVRNGTDARYEAAGVSYGNGIAAVRAGAGRTVGLGAVLSF